MGLFKKKDAAEDAQAPAPESQVSSAHQKKSGPTPTRKEAEAARKARVNPTLSKQERRRREGDAARRERMEQASRRDADPGRTLLRDVVDSRFRLGEVVMPVLLIVLALSLVVSRNELLANGIMILFYVIVLAVIADLVLMWRQFTRLLEERHPGHHRSGLFMYGMNRTLQIRRWRMPPPRVKRGDTI